MFVALVFAVLAEPAILPIPPMEIYNIYEPYRTCVLTKGRKACAEERELALVRIEAYMDVEWSGLLVNSIVSEVLEKVSQDEAIAIIDRRRKAYVEFLDEGLPKE